MSGAFGTNWLDLSSTSNRYIQSYYKGFVDISGGPLYVRNNNLFVQGGDVSLNGRLYSAGDASLNNRLFLGSDAYLNGNLSVMGNIGIGTTTPLYKIDASGAIKASQFILSSSSVFTPTVSTTSSASWVNNGITWTASSSSYYLVGGTNYPSWVAFNNTNKSGNNIKFATSGYYNNGIAVSATGTPILTTTYNGSAGPTVSGEWLQIQTSIPLVMTNFTLGSSDQYGTGQSLPKTYLIVGSNDGNTFYPIQYGYASSQYINAQLTNSSVITINYSGSQNAGLSNITTQIYAGSTTSSYNYFRIYASSLFSATNGTVFETSLWNINFSRPSGIFTIDSSLSQVNVNTNFFVGGVLNTTSDVSFGGKLYVAGNSTVNSINTSGVINFNTTLTSPTVTPDASQSLIPAAVSGLAAPYAQSWTVSGTTWTVSSSVVNGITLGQQATPGANNYIYAYYPAAAFVTYVTNTSQSSGGVRSWGYLGYHSATLTNGYYPFNGAVSAYTTTSGVTGGIGTLYGNWIQIQSSSATSITSFAMAPERGYTAMSGPGAFYILGTNDGSFNTWYPILYGLFPTSQVNNNTSNAYYKLFVSGTNTTGSVTEIFPIPNGSASSVVNGQLTYTTYGNATNSYSYFRLVVTGAQSSSGVFFNLYYTFSNYSSSNAQILLDSALANVLDVSGKLQVTDGLNLINSDASLNGNVYVGKDLTVNGNLYVQTYNARNMITELSYQLIVAEDISVNGRLFLSNDASINGRLFLGADVSMGGKLFTVGDTSHNARLYVGSDASINGSLFVNSRTINQGDISANNRLFIGADASFSSRLFTIGDVSFNNRLYVGLDASINGNFYVGKNMGIAKVPTYPLDISGISRTSGAVIFGTLPTTKYYTFAGTPSTATITSPSLTFTFGSSSFYAKFNCFLSDASTNTISSVIFDVQGGNAAGTTPSNNIAEITRVSTINGYYQWLQPTYTTTTVVLGTTANTGVVANYSVRVELIQTNAVAANLPTLNSITMVNNNSGGTVVTSFAY